MLSATIARRLGIASFVVLIVQIVVLCASFLIASTARGGGHPPGGVLIVIIAGLGCIVASPVGILLGLLAMRHRTSIGIVGLVGNVLLLLLIVFGLRAIGVPLWS